MNLKILSILLMTASFSYSQAFGCVGGREACEKERVLDRLEQLTGEQCAGGYDACKEYLESILEEQRFQHDFSSANSHAESDFLCFPLKGKMQCAKTVFNNDSSWSADKYFNMNNPPKGVRCFMNTKSTGLCFRI